MRVKTDSIRDSSYSSTAKIKDDFFLTKNLQPEEKEVKVVTDGIPEHFEDYSATDHQSLSINCESTRETTDILIEDVVVEYKTCAGKEQTFRDFKITYLKTYVSVGIPDERYKWIFEKMLKISGKKIWWTPKHFKNGYTWVSARIPPESHVYEEAYCYVYSSDRNETKPIGTLTDVITRLKSNVIGYGQFRIRVVKNFHGAYVLSLLLTGFQMVDITNKQSRKEPFVMIEPSKKLMESLENLNLI